MRKVLLGIRADTHYIEEEPPIVISPEWTSSFTVACGSAIG